jgi:Flp pilus assembly pilin Flp
MRRFLNKLLKNQKGQGMTEYLIIVALIAIAAIGVVTVFGSDIRQLFNATTNSLSGGQGANNSVTAKVNTQKTIKTFGGYNAASGDK